MNPTVKGNLIRLSKLAGALLLCVIQVLFFFQIMPYGGFYIGLLSLVLDLSIYCWVASGAHKSVTAPRSRGKSTARLGRRLRASKYSTVRSGPLIEPKPSPDQVAKVSCSAAGSRRHILKTGLG